MQKYEIDIEAVVQHNYWSGKNCPNRIRAGQPYSWQQFLLETQREYKALKEQTEPTDQTLKAEIEKLRGVLRAIENLIEGVNV